MAGLKAEVKKVTKAARRYGTTGVGMAVRSKVASVSIGQLASFKDTLWWINTDNATFRFAETRTFARGTTSVHT